MAVLPGAEAARRSHKRLAGRPSGTLTALATVVCVMVCNKTGQRVIRMTPPHECIITRSYCVKNYDECVIKNIVV
jgi:hypothetical protein